MRPANENGGVLISPCNQTSGLASVPGAMICHS
jgi:hypothetical protein